MILYAKRHWTGQTPLAWAFWVNLVAVRLGVGLLQAWLIPAAGGPKGLLFLLAFFVHGLLLLWQVVGVIRAAETHLKTSGALAPVWGTQLACLVVFAFALMDAWGLWHSAQPIPPEDTTMADIEAARAKTYSIAAQGSQASFAGTIALGTTKALRAFLNDHPEITSLHLTSEGGNIYEGRGLGQVIRKAGLSTHVPDHCASACLLAFIGGATRTLGPDAKLGFHQYRVEAGYDVPLADPAGEAEKDRALFKGAGVSAAFTAKMFDASPDGMWFPTHLELTEAGVLN